MKNFRWILLAGLLVTAPQLAHAQPGTGAPGAPGAPGTTAANGPGAISNNAATTTTTTTIAPSTATGVSPDAEFVPADGAATGDRMSKPGNTGGEPLLVTLAGLSIAAMAFGLRRKVGRATA